MRGLLLGMLIIVMLPLGSCTYSRGAGGRANYAVTVRYLSDRLAGSAVAAKSLLVLPVLTVDGPDSVRFPSPTALSNLLRTRNGDMEFLYPGPFEEKYKAQSGGGAEDIGNFYRALYAGKTLAVQTNDSVWKAIETPYFLSLYVKYAASIRGLSGAVCKRLVIEAELWDVGASEAVWRSEVVGINRNADADDKKFVTGAITEVLGTMPDFLPEADEKDW